MTISRLDYGVHVPGSSATYSPVSGTVTLDESWSPYVGSTITVPLPADASALAALDPRSGARVTVRISQQFGHPFTLGTITQAVGGAVAAWTGNLDGAPLSAWTGRFGSPYNATGARASRVAVLNLGVRERAIDYDAGLVDLTLASDEALMQDIVNLDSIDRVPTTDTIYDVVTLALASIGAAASFEAPDVALEADSTAWVPGQSAWDYVLPLVDAAGLRLWCDEGRQWHLALPSIPEGSALSFSPSNSTRLRDTIGRDDLEGAGWFDAVHVTYRWRNALDVEQVRYDVARAQGATKAYTVEYTRPFPGTGAAAAILARSRGRGRVEGVVAVLNPGARPRQPIRVNIPNGPIQTGFVTQVQWDLGADTMTILTRDLTDTPQTAWVLAEGTWADVQGIPWDDVASENEEA